VLSKLNSWALQLACSAIVVMFIGLCVGTLFANVRRMNVVLTMSWPVWLVLGAAVLAVRWLLFNRAHREDE
jgi:hypothetical protein